MQQQSNKKNRN